MMRYAVVIEKGDGSFGAYVPDLPGCVAVAETEADVRQLIAEAIELHLQAMLTDGEVGPAPSTEVEYVDVHTPASV